MRKEPRDDQHELFLAQYMAMIFTYRVVFWVVTRRDGLKARQLMNRASGSSCSEQTSINERIRIYPII